jgi:hypothetical protein
VFEMWDVFSLEPIRKQLWTMTLLWVYFYEIHHFGLLSDFKKIYQFALVNCMAKPNLKKTADLLE